LFHLIFLWVIYVQSYLPQPLSACESFICKGANDVKDVVVF